MNYWLVKQEPTAYSWQQLLDDGQTAWTGVRNFQARNNLQAMKAGDAVLYYHSVVGKEVVGVAKVVRAAYPDPTGASGPWVCVDIAPETTLPNPVSLEMIKADPALSQIPLVKQSRLSVMPLEKGSFERILVLGGL